MPFPVDEKYILAAEEEIGARLPESFRNHILEENGGEIETEEDVWDIYPVWDKSDKNKIARTSNHIIRETNVAKDWRGFPNDAIAFASNGCGDLLIFMKDKSGKSFSDSVFEFNHETGETTEIVEDLSELL